MKLKTKLKAKIERFLRKNYEMNDEEKMIDAYFRKMLRDKSSTIIIWPSANKRYLQSNDKAINIILSSDARKVFIGNHKYSYDIGITQWFNDWLCRKFDQELSVRRDEMEKSMKANILNSLKNMNDF